MSRAFTWFLAGVGSQFIPFGLHGVLFAWMVAVHLGEGGVRLGIAQMAAQLPGLLFVLFGGVLADRYDRRRILITCHCLIALPPLVLAASINAGMLTYSLLLVFAVTFGSFNAFITPARDSLLNQVSGPNLQKAVTLTMGLQFVAQIIGFGIAGQADRVGPVPLLLVQGGALVLGAAFALKLPTFTPVRDSLEAEIARNRRGALGDIADGLKMVFGSERMAPVMVLMFGVGIFYVGSFNVVNPLVVRDLYGGAAADIALSFICFMVGTIFTTVLLISVGGIRRQGTGLMIALVTGGVFLGATNLQLPFTGYLFCIGLWGVCGGVAMSLGRSIIQESAPDEYRARAMSIFLLGTVGGGPVGALMMGFLTVYLGALQSYLVALGGMAVLVLIVGFSSNLSTVNRLSH